MSHGGRAGPSAGAGASSRTGATQERQSAAAAAKQWLAKALAGTGAGVVSTALCSPLDVAKTRVQVQTTIGAQSPRYSGIFPSLLTIYREEGLRGWYHGFTPAVCSVAVFWTCYFPCYDRGKELVSTASGLPQSSSMVHVVAAAGAGLLTDVITNPLWVVRTRLATQALRDQESVLSGTGAASKGAAGVPQAHVAAAAACPAGGEPYYRSMRHAFARIYAEEGTLAFFAGLSASILGLSHIMIQFPLYEYIKQYLGLRHQRLMVQQGCGRDGERADGLAAGGGEPAPDASPTIAAPTWHIVAASGVSKFFASTITYPHEVIRARLQFDTGAQLYTGIVDATRKTLQNDGFGGLWLGFRLNIVRTIPQSIVTFTLYEHLSHRLQAALGLYSSTSNAASTSSPARQNSIAIARTRSENRA